MFVLKRFLSGQGDRTLHSNTSSTTPSHHTLLMFSYKYVGSIHVSYHLTKAFSTGALNKMYCTQPALAGWSNRSEKPAAALERSWCHSFHCNHIKRYQRGLHNHHFIIYLSHYLLNSNIHLQPKRAEISLLFSNATLLIFLYTLLFSPAYISKCEQGCFVYIYNFMFTHYVFTIRPLLASPEQHHAYMRTWKSQLKKTCFPPPCKNMFPEGQAVVHVLGNDGAQRSVAEVSRCED